VITDTQTKSAAFTTKPSDDRSPSGSSPRQSAISAAIGRRFSTAHFDYIETSPEDIFGENVFGKSAMKKRLPEEIFKSLMSTIEAGKKLDSTAADVVA